MLLLMDIEAPSPTTGRLTPTFFGRISRRGSKAPSTEDPNPGGLLVPRQTSRSSDSEGSHSIRSIRSNGSNARNLIRKISTRFKRSRSPSNAALDGLTPLTLSVDDFKQGDIHNWKLGFSKYNQLVTNQISKDQSYQSDEFSSICKALTKQCGEGFVHGLPEAVFDFALLWCPTGKLVRKQYPTTEPSWSWTGWEGAGVNFPFDPTSCPDIRGEEGNLFKSEVLNYHLGPESAPWTIRRERKQPLKIQYIPYFHAPQGLQRPMEEADTLRFSAFTISATNLKPVQLMNDHEEELPYCELKDDKDQHCGNIMDYRSLVSAQDDKERTFEYVLLSRNRRFPVHDNTKRPALNTAHPPGTPIWDNGRFLWDQTLEDFDTDKFEEREWCMLNVMLIEHQEEGWTERVAIGQIHEDAWNALNPVKKDICLR